MENGWLYEAGIGEDRAIYVVDGSPVKFRVERHGGGAKVGALMDAKFVSQWVAGKSGIAQLPSGEECLLQPLPKGLSEGAAVRVEITREAISERGGQFRKVLAKKALARPAPKNLSLTEAPDMMARLKLSGHPVQQVYAHDANIFAELGWNEALEEAASGLLQFDGGSLIISHTPAMTVIDVDGTLNNLDLSKRAAKEVAKALVRMDITGNIGIDFPTLPAKSDRSAVAEIFDEHMSAACERTAINGFGFMQIVRRKVRPSFCQTIQSDTGLTSALRLVRQAERSGITGKMRLVVHPAIASKLDSNPSWITELGKRAGAEVTIASDASIAIEGGLVSRG